MSQLSHRKWFRPIELSHSRHRTTQHRSEVRWEMSLPLMRAMGHLWERVSFRHNPHWSFTLIRALIYFFTFGGHRQGAVKVLPTRTSSMFCLHWGSSAQSPTDRYLPEGCTSNPPESKCCVECVNTDSWERQCPVSPPEVIPLRMPAQLLKTSKIKWSNLSCSPRSRVGSESATDH